jgi:hypothetical protein
MEAFKRELLALARQKLQRPGTGGTEIDPAFANIFGDAYASSVLQALVKKYAGQ